MTRPGSLVALSMVAAVAAGGAAVSQAGTGVVAATPKRTVIKLYVPPAGQVSLELVRLKVIGKDVSAFKLPKRFHLVR